MTANFTVNDNDLATAPRDSVSGFVWLMAAEMASRGGPVSSATVSRAYALGLRASVAAAATASFEKQLEAEAEALKATMTGFGPDGEGRPGYVGMLFGVRLYEVQGQVQDIVFESAA